MRALAQNLRIAFRQLRRVPGFTLTVVLTLALGIGATTAIFSLVEGVLLRPLPFQEADRLVLLGDHLGAGPGISVTAREIGTYSSATEAFSSLGGYITTGYELSSGEQPERVNAARLSANMFLTLRVQPILGRVFTAQEENTYQPLAVISDGLWLNRYHRDPRALGASIVLDRKTYSIIGVMPRSFEFPLQTGHLDQVQIWVPLSLTPDELSDQHAGFWGYHIIARLKDGVTLAQAVSDTDRVAHQIMHSFPVTMSALHIRGDVELLRDHLVADVRPLLGTLFLAVAIVLLIACVNTSSLLLVRAIRRRREYAVRLALGARSSVIIREAVCEGVLLSVTGGLLGLAFAATAIRTALGLLPESMPRIDSISMDATVATFALLLALATGALCSLAPAFAALRTNVTESLKEGAQIGMGSSSHTLLRSVLVVLVASYQLPLSQYPTGASVDAFNHAVVDRLSNKPGVMAVGITSGLPASDVFAQSSYTIEGASVDSWKLKFAAFAITYGDYFTAMRIPLLDGRTFTMQDGANAPLAAMVNQSMARHSWPGQNAIGKRLHVGNPQKGLPWATVVGVVADTKLGSRDEPSGDQWYFPAPQPAILFGSEGAGNLTRPAGGYLAVRAALAPEHMTQTLRSAIAEIDPLLALQQPQPMNDVLSNVEAPRRFNTGLITAFALGALLLAMTGIYAVVAFSVSLRTQEIAIRMALGAQRGGIARLILVAGAKLGLLGCGFGVLGSLAASRLVRSFLFDVSATDPLVYIAAVLTMMLMALLASALPATRAASADPIQALRSV